MPTTSRTLSLQRPFQNLTKSVSGATASTSKLSTKPRLKSEDYALKLFIKEIEESTSYSNLEAAAAKAS